MLHFKCVCNVTTLKVSRTFSAQTTLLSASTQNLKPSARALDGMAAVTFAGCIQQISGVQCEGEMHSVHSEGFSCGVRCEICHAPPQLQTQQQHHDVQQRLLACAQSIE